MNGERFIEANRVAQAILVAVLLIGIAIFASKELLVNRWLPGAGATLEELTQFLIASLVFCVSAAMFWSFYFGRMGFRAIASGEFPPPGTLVVRRTKVRFGLIARVSAWLSIAFALISWLPVALLAYVLYLVERAT